MIQFGDAAKNRMVPVGESMVQKAVDSKYLKELKTKELFSGKKGEAISPRSAISAKESSSSDSKKRRRRMK